MGDIQEPVPLVSLLPLRHQSATSICNGVSSGPAMSSTSYPRAHYNSHPISLQPSAPLKWLAGGFDIPTQTPRNASSHTIHFFFPFRSVFSFFCLLWQYSVCTVLICLNPLNPELNPICYLLALLGAHHFFHVSRIRVKSLTFRRLMSYIYGAPILDVSRSHTTTQHSR